MSNNISPGYKYKYLWMKKSCHSSRRCQLDPRAIGDEGQRRCWCTVNKNTVIPSEKFILYVLPLERFTQEPPFTWMVQMFCCSCEHIWQCPAAFFVCESPRKRSQFTTDKCLINKNSSGQCSESWTLRAFCTTAEFLTSSRQKWSLLSLWATGRFVRSSV